MADSQLLATKTINLEAAQVAGKTVVSRMRVTIALLAALHLWVDQELSKEILAEDKMVLFQRPRTARTKVKVIQEDEKMADSLGQRTTSLRVAQRP